MTKVFVTADDHAIELQNKDVAAGSENKIEESSYLDAGKQARRVLRGPLAPINNFLNHIEKSIISFIKKQQKTVKICVAVLIVISYLVYFCFAISIDADRATDLIYVTVFGFFCFFYWLIKKFFGEGIWNGCMKPIKIRLDANRCILKWTLYLCFFAFLVFWISWDTAKDPSRLISLAGLATFILIGFLSSKKRDQIKWRPVIWGFVLQFIFGLLILRTTVGYEVFKWLGDRVSIFLSFSKPGAELIFGPSTTIAFSILPIIVYFSSFTYVLYYLGWMQVVVNKVAWILQITMGITMPESLNIAGNIFLGQTEAVFLIRPFLKNMTKSELHAILTGGFATIAGSLLAVYVKFGISASHLLSASVMSAPAALAMSKLMYPETEETEFLDDEVEVQKPEEKNIFEAVAVGAAMSIGPIANITVMMMSFVSLISLLNAILSWLGSMVGLSELSFEFICSYLFMPLAFLMGVEWKDSFHIAELIGVKTFLTEFFAYLRLSKLVDNRIMANDGIKLSIRSEVISTYALCGFSNFGSMGVILGCLSGIIPNKRSILAQLVFRALIAGTLACFMTACIAGVLYEETKYKMANTTIT